MSNKIKNKGNIGLNNGDLFCFNCKASSSYKHLENVEKINEFMKNFHKQHRNCKK